MIIISRNSSFISICSIFILNFLSCSRADRKGDIPYFDLLLKDSTTLFSTAQIPTGKAIVLIYFSPDCEHCQEQTKNILQKIDSLQNVNFYFITTDPLDRLKMFDKYYKLYNYKNITIGRDIHFSFLKYYKPPGTPYLIVFNHHKNLRAVFDGEIKVSQLIPFMTPSF